ncbi:TIGR03862 family flavoprotein [Marimonas arenosa]|uniref:TIGR03862 family flavoprotein n=1 Tax=Marimonas arenosa TaxID=1795305 RepID=A0AAE4B437_9RHOB|nr:TIGR03862 family flavoprotein [Marimonas arenosa]MDQ2089825.1 TIGR03862 family flavoprotein [Marimonas arenosa]
MSDALVIGAGPAGLMAAEELARAGLSVTIAEAKPSPARKLLMAGKSGLNLTKDEPFETFLAAYGNRATVLRPMLEAFGPEDVKAWAEDLGQVVFTGSSGRVFPRVMKASPLLRAWLRRLDRLGVTLKTRWRWQGGGNVDTPDGRVTLAPRVTLLACGGASWARLGSDGAWTRQFAPGDLASFRPANMGFVIDWSDHMARHFGAPVKNVVLKAGETEVRAEFTLSSRGLEGGGIYAVSRAMRDGAPLTLDLLPDLSVDSIRARLNTRPPKESLSNRLRKGLRLDPVKQALVMEFARPLPTDIAPLLKGLPVPHLGPRPLDEAISTAGGLRFEALDDGLMLRRQPGVFACGEMLDWEAPTGGYLLTACLATGRWAGRHAAAFVTG